MRSLLAALVLALSVFAYAEEAIPPVPAEGAAAPVFKLPSQDGSEVSLGQYKGKWVVLDFYPKDFTGGCLAKLEQ